MMRILGLEVDDVMIDRGCVFGSVCVRYPGSMNKIPRFASPFNFACLRASATLPYRIRSTFCLVG